MGGQGSGGEWRGEEGRRWQGTAETVELIHLRHVFQRDHSLGEVAVVLHSLQGQLTAEGGAGTGQHVVEDVVVPVGWWGREGKGEKEVMNVCIALTSRFVSVCSGVHTSLDTTAHLYIYIIMSVHQWCQYTHMYTYE